MNQPNFDKWGEMAKKMQEPFKAIAELNVKTLQGLTYLKPEELAQVKKPEEMLCNTFMVLHPTNRPLRTHIKPLFGQQKSQRLLTFLS